MTYEEEEFRNALHTLSGAEWEIDGGVAYTVCDTVHRADAIVGALAMDMPRYYGECPEYIDAVRRAVVSYDETSGLWWVEVPLPLKIALEAM